MNILLESDAIVSAPSSEILVSSKGFRARLASTRKDRQAAFRLRYQVFNVEMGDGLSSAHVDGMDMDRFDRVCEHLLVEEVHTNRVVGTYRLQHGEIAARNHGYYSAREFDFAPYEKLRPEMLELGRACIHQQYRSLQVLMLLWRGIIAYAQRLGARYMIGCSSLSSQDTQVGSEMYFGLSQFWAEGSLRTTPRGEFAFELAPASSGVPDPPKLLKAYLAIGAKICAAPAIDRDFGTIDFLTFIDLEHLSSAGRQRLLR